MTTHKNRALGDRNRFWTPVSDDCLCYDLDGDGMDEIAAIEGITWR